ncbi:hypothetical protein BX666DRAFT_2030809 [Dichotomocladium elegans]|nr:hypothetical protein BX666DRAFT_2030809 [Dichotomocladium elegans]
MALDPFRCNTHLPEVVDPFITDLADFSLQHHHHELPTTMNAPPPSPQEPSNFDTGSTQNVSAPLESDETLVNDVQRRMAMHKHASMLNQLLRQAARHCNGRHHRLCCNTDNDPAEATKRNLKKKSAATILKRRTRAVAAHHVVKPSRIPIATARLRARIAATRATNDLADAIAMVNLS